MENPKNSRHSFVHTEYGTTTLDHFEIFGDEPLKARFPPADFAYQKINSTYPHRKHKSRSNKMSMDTMPNSETRQIMERIEHFLNVLSHVCIGFVTIFMSWMCLRVGLAKTALHAWLVTLGFTLLMAEGIMSHYSGNVVTFNYKRTTKTRIHWVLQAIGGTVGVVGVLIKCFQKGFLLHSVHGKLGFAAFILCVCSMLSGLMALYSMRVKHIYSPLLNKSFHNFIGVVTFLIAMLAQYFGYETGFFRQFQYTDFQLWMKSITMILLALTLIGPLKAMYHKICNIVRHFDS